MTSMNLWCCKRNSYRIIHTEPYLYKDILDSPEAIRKKREELKNEIIRYREYKVELEKQLTKLKEEM